MRVLHAVRPRRTSRVGTGHKRLAADKNLFPDGQTRYALNSTLRLLLVWKDPSGTSRLGNGCATGRKGIQHEKDELETSHGYEKFGL